MVSTAALGDGDGLFSFPLFSNKFYLLLLSFFPSSVDYLLFLSFFPSSDDGGDDAVRPRRRRRGEAPLPLTAVGSDPFLTHGILPTKAAFFLAGGLGSGVFLVP